MLQAMNTGHDGSLSTVHSNSPRDGLHRIETMVMMAGYDLPLRAIRQHIAAALDLLVHIDRMEDGSRRVVAVTEVLRMESDVIQLQDIFEFEIESVAPGPDDHGWSQGHRPSPHLPRQVPQAWHRAPAEHVRRARALARRAKGRNGVKVNLRIAIASAAAVALALPTLALGQGAAPKLSESPTSGFPDKAYILTLPTTQALTASKLDGHGERTRRVGSCRRSTWRIEERRDSAHRRLEQHERRSDQECDGRSTCLPRGAEEGPPGRDRRLRPDDDTVSRTSRTNTADLADAVAKTPVTSEGTHIYDALIKAASMAKDQGLERTTVVLLSDGTELRKRATSRAEALQR